MAVNKFDINTDAIVRAKRANLEKRQSTTPSAAVVALAEMQSIPQPVLNVVTARQQVTVIGEVSYTNPYDPVGRAIQYAFYGVDAITFFTDERVYPNGLDDLLLVSRGIKRPVIMQDYILNEYHVAEVRAAGAAAVTLYASILPPDMLRRTVSVAQRWRMTAIMQVDEPQHIDMIPLLSPHVVAVGNPHRYDLDADLATLEHLRGNVPHHTRVMLLGCLPSLDAVEAALALGVDGIIVDERVLGDDDSRAGLRDLIGNYTHSLDA